MPPIARSQAAAPTNPLNPGEAPMLYFNAAGSQVSEGDPTAVRQFLADDPHGPGGPLERHPVTLHTAGCACCWART